MTKQTETITSELDTMTPTERASVDVSHQAAYREDGHIWGQVPEPKSGFVCCNGLPFHECHKSPRENCLRLKG